MFRRFPFGSVLGIPLKLDVTFLVVLPLFAWLIGAQLPSLIDLTNSVLGTTVEEERLSSGAWPWVLGSIAAVGLFVGVLLHELGHALVAMRFGYTIDSITLWLFGGLAHLTEHPDTWSHELAIALAGPLVSVGIGVLSYLMLWPAQALGQSIVFVLGYLALMNVALAGFNLLPAFPMDGGRVLRALLSRNRPFVEATTVAAEVGKLLAVLMAVFGLIRFNIVLVGIAFFIYIAAAGEAQQTVVRTAFDGVAVERVMSTDVAAVGPDLSVADLLDRMYREKSSGYPVLEGERLVGVVTLEDARTVPEAARADRRVGGIMTRSVKTIDPGTAAITALEIMRGNDIGRLLVADDDGRLVGSLSRRDLIRAFEGLRDRREPTEPTTRPDPPGG